MEKFSVIKNCRLCNSADIVDLFSFGQVASANAYIRREDLEKDEEKFPLTPCLCNSCGHLQIHETINREFLFSNYLYASSTSGSLSKYFENYANELIDFLKLSPENGYILDCGSNDGVTLQHFKNKGFSVIGVEPAENLAKIANEKGIFTINDFFGEKLAAEIFEKHGFPALIISNNTYAHLEQHHDFTKGVRLLLNNKNCFVFENAHALPTIEKFYFDQFYHDHLGYFWLKPLIKYFNNLGLDIFHAEKTPNQGGSIRVFVTKNIHSGFNDGSVEKILNEEIEFGLDKISTYETFFTKLKNIQNSFKEILQKYLAAGKSISCYGCPAKFVLFSKFFGLNNQNVKYVVDDSVFKQGLFSPESKIEIVSREFFVKNPTDACIVSAWNFEDFIKKSNQQFKGIWLNPFQVTL